LAPDIAKLCARRAEAVTVRGLTEVVREMDAAEGELPRLQGLALRFWEELVRGADNIAYELAFNSLKETYALVEDALQQVMADELRDIDSCRAIVSAVTVRDADRAEQLARTLISRGTRRVLVLIAMLEEQSSGPNQGASS